MKKLLLLSSTILLLFSCIPVSYAEENEPSITAENIIQSQQNNLKISDFLQEAKRLFFRFIRKCRYSKFIY